MDSRRTMEVMATSPFGNNMDPLASYRKTMEQTRKIMDPTAGYQRYLERTKPVDPLGTRRIMDQARMAMDPMGEYRRIMSDFSQLVGVEHPPDEETTFADETPSSSSHFSPSLVLALPSVA